MFRPGHRLIALNVQINIRGNRGRYFMDPFRPAAVLGGSQASAARVLLADIQNLPGIGGHDDVVKPGACAHGFVNPGDQGPSGYFAQHLAGQARGGETRRDNCDHFHRE